jgi:flagellin-like hook-associated protein FlgL
MSMFTSTIDYLLHQRKPVEIDFDRSLARLRASGNASKLAVMEGNAGALSKQVHMEADNALQVTERNTFQKANTYMQFQEEGIKYANILYSQMATLALRASDPDMSKSERAVLATQFNELREIALDLNYETFTDYYLFDPRSSTTDFSEASNWELYWKRHQAFKPDGKIDIASAAYGGKFIKDGEAEEELAEKLYNAPLTTASASGDTQSEGRSITRDVVYNEGFIELAFNTGNLGEIFEIIQGDPNGDHRVLFNSGEFKTKGEANNYDLQYLKFEYGPAMQTTLDAAAKPPSSPKLDGSHIPHWIGSPDDFLTQQQDKFGNSLWSVENREFEEKVKWGYDDLLWQD